MTPTDIARVLADHVAGLEYEHLPAPAVAGAKKTVLDALGVMLAASGSEPAVAPVLDLVRECGGRPESTVLGVGIAAPAVMAAFANGALAHSLNFDDQTPWGQHAAASVVPAALAVAERMGGVSGAELITAVAAGQDLFARLRRNVGWRKDWNLSTVFGVFAATASAGRLLRLTGGQLHHAFAIATMQSSGLMEVVGGPGSDLGGIYAGFPAKGGVVSALMARSGTRGVESVFEGATGLFQTYFNGVYDRDAMLDGLGRDFTGSGTLYKPWPAIGTAHSHIHATIEIVREHDIAVEDIAEVRLPVGDCHELLCEPLAARCAPASLLDARFSLPFLVALAAVRRDLGITDLSTDALGDPRVLDLARRVVPVRDPDLDWRQELPTGRVEFRLNDGRTLVREGTNVPGSAAAPLTWAELEAKFASCATAAAVTITPGRIDDALALARRLEHTTDATDLIRAMTPTTTRRRVDRGRHTTEGETRWARWTARSP
jgi:2-methylcitrate dehydratase PrpD